MQTLFSEHWHIVCNLQPTLKSNVKAFPRILRGRKWYLLYEPIGQRFIKIHPSTWNVLNLFNGNRSVSDVWDEAARSVELRNKKYGLKERAISQHELVLLLSNLYRHDMLQTNESFDAQDLVQRYKEKKKAKIKQLFLNPLGIKFPLIYPDEFFSKYSSFARFIFTFKFFLFWLIVCIPALLIFLENWQNFSSNLSDQILSTKNLFILWFIYPFIKAIHETAHALAIKANGGHVREMGVMLLLFIPIPYVDASSSYAFESKWSRIVVALAGILTEVFLGCLAIYIWQNTQNGILHAFAYNVVFIGIITTVIVNGNPLMKYDGYYAFSDLVEIPNLNTRASKYLVFLSDKYLFGAKDIKEPFDFYNEKIWLFFYGFSAPIYRLSVTFGIIFFVAHEYFFFGVILAVLAFSMSILFPLYKGWKHIVKGDSLVKYRQKAMFRFKNFIILAILLTFIIPLPYNSTQQGVVWLPEEAAIYAKEDGFITYNHSDGHSLVKGDPLFILKNTNLTEQKNLLELQLSEIDLKIRGAYFNNFQEKEKLETQKNGLIEQLQFYNTKNETLEEKAKDSGTWYLAENKVLHNAFYKKGETVGYVVNEPTKIIRSAVTQAQYDLIQTRLNHIEIKLKSNLGEVYQGKIIRSTPQAQNKLLSHALSFENGGNILTDPKDPEGLLTLETYMDLEIQVDKPIALNAYGSSTYIKYDLGYSPLAIQWYRQLKQLFLEQFDV